MPFHISYSPDAEDHLRSLTARERAIILQMVDKQLLHQPTVAMRNRKPMRDNPLAFWELRIGDFRVYYDVVEDPEQVVHIRAVGVKRRNRVRFGNEVKEL